MRLPMLILYGTLVLPAAAQEPQSASARLVDTSQARPSEQPDARWTRDELYRILNYYPPSLRAVLSLDPSLLSDQSYLAPYPALTNYVSSHPEIARNPSFFFGDYFGRRYPADESARSFELWREVLGGVAGFAGFGIAIGLIVWLIRTVIDYRRWNRLTRVQTEVHSKLMDRFTANDDLLAYIQSAAGSKFLESTPITLDAGPRSVSEPLGRILWSVQAGLIIAAAGIGLRLVGDRVSTEASQPLHALGILGIALGIGFVISASISFVISRRLGLIHFIAKEAGAGEHSERLS